jgi:predicted anti-sigma-YlaC factor YlaD
MVSSYVEKPAAWRSLEGAILLFFAVVSLVNAAWMLAGPMHWYQELPAGVPDTGPFNAHFVRDIGCAFIAVGVALLWAALEPRWRVPLVTIAAIFYGAHAALHVYDTLRGALDADHWALDLPGVYLPAVLLVWLTLRVRRT